MAKRILLVITPDVSGDLRSAARSAAALAPESGSVVRMVSVRPLPPPRVDRYDRVVADEDREMARLADAADERMAALRWELGAVDVERVPVVLLPLAADGGDSRRGESVVLPAFR